MWHPPFYFEKKKFDTLKITNLCNVELSPQIKKPKWGSFNKGNIFLWLKLYVKCIFIANLEGGGGGI